MEGTRANKPLTPECQIVQKSEYVELIRGILERVCERERTEDQSCSGLQVHAEFNTFECNDYYSI